MSQKTAKQLPVQSAYHLVKLLSSVWNFGFYFHVIV